MVAGQALKDLVHTEKAGQGAEVGEQGWSWWQERWQGEGQE